MVVNENELMQIDNDPAIAASLLDGELLSEGECINQFKKLR